MELRTFERGDFRGSLMLMRVFDSSVFRFALVCALGVLGGDALASETAYSAVRAALPAAGSGAMDRLLDVRGDDGAPMPRTWRVTFGPGGSLKEATVFEVRDGKVARRTTAAAGVSARPIDLKRIQVDSDNLFEMVNHEAVVAQVAFDRVDYVLSAEGQTPGFAAVWYAELKDSKYGWVGSLRVASESRAVLERNFSEKAIALSNQGDRWSKPGEPFKGGSRFIPDAAHRATKWTERFGVKVKNWWQGNGWQGNGGQDSWKREDR